MNREEFFAQLMALLEGENQTSDPSYYVDGDATAEDYRNIIKVAFERTEAGSAERQAFIDLMGQAGFWAESDDLDYWLNADATDEGNLNDLMNAAEERLPRVSDQVDPVTGDLAGDDVVKAVGAEGATGLLEGGTVHRVNNPGGQADYFIVAYEYPPGSGHSFYYQFDSIEQLEAAIGPNMGGGSYPVGSAIDEANLANWTDGGDAAGNVVGVDGTWGAYINEAVAEAANAMGGQDPTKWGTAMQDPEMQFILAKVAEGNLTDAEVKAMMRETEVYKTYLYPGIENFYGSSTNPEAEWRSFVNNVEPALKRLGIVRDADGSYSSQIMSLLDSGVSDIALVNFVPVYQKAQTNQGFAAQLSKWTEQFTGTAITDFESWFDVLAGNAPEEVLEIAEVASLAWVADQQGFQISDSELQFLGEQLDLDENQGRQLFSSTARQLLALGASGLSRGGLTAEQVLRAEAGIGGDVESLRQKVNKLAVEEGIMDDPSAKFFTDFNREGAPVKLGLASGVSEGA